MKKTFIYALLIFSGYNAHSQDSSLNKLKDWLTNNNISLRKSFDGSRNENKPAGLLFRQDYLLGNNLLNIDLAIKLFQLEILKNTHSSLLFYPKVEWHKSTNFSDLKNKLDGGFNAEFFPFGMKSPHLPEGLPNKGLVISPWFLGTSSFKRNYVDNVFETKLAVQISFASNYKYLPGFSYRDKKNNFRFRYYPYFGLEYNRIPDLISKGKTEKITIGFVRLFAEIWIIPRTLQFNIDGTYRHISNNKSVIRTSLPIINPSLYYYPGNQEAISIGYDYRHGYDPDYKFQLVEIASVTLNVKL